MELGSLYKVEYMQGECKYFLHDEHDDTSFILDAIIFHAQLGAYFSPERARRIIDKLVSSTPVLIDFVNAQAGVPKSVRVNGSRAVSYMSSAKVIDDIQNIRDNPMIIDKNAAIAAYHESMMQSLFQER